MDGGSCEAEMGIIGPASSFAREEVLEERLALVRENALRMVLNSFYAMLLVSDSHNDATLFTNNAFSRFSCDLEILRQGFWYADERMVASAFGVLWCVMEETLVVVDDLAGFAMNDFVSPADGAAVG